MNVICGKPLSHHGTQTLLPLLCRQVNANDTRLYAWVSQLINDPFEATLTPVDSNLKLNNTGCSN